MLLEEVVGNSDSHLGKASEFKGYLSMMPYSHLFFGVILGYALFSGDVTTNLFVLFLIGNVIPDFDYVILNFLPEKYKLRNHRDFFTHWPVVWLFCIFIAMFLKNDFFLWFSMGGLSHLVLDTVDWGVAWLVPIKNGKISLLSLQNQVQSTWRLKHFLVAYYKNKVILMLEALFFTFSLLIAMLLYIH